MSELMKTDLFRVSVCFHRYKAYGDDGKCVALHFWWYEKIIRKILNLNMNHEKEIGMLV